MIRFYTFLLTIIPNLVFACPACAGGKTDDGYTTIIVLGIFIALTYIPMAYLFKLIVKNKSINKVSKSS